MRLEEIKLRTKYWKGIIDRVMRRKLDATTVAVSSSPGTRLDAELLAAHLVTCSWPDLYYEKVQTLIGLTSPKCLVEVGVAYGYHAQHILRHNPRTRYVGVDPYLAAYDPGDGFDKDVAKLFDTEPIGAMNRLFLAVSEGLKGEFGDRFRLVRSPSAVAAKEFDDLSVPFVFIDGDHRYEAVLADLRAWWPKVESGGVLVGDDHIWPGVERAAKEFFNALGHPYFVIDGPERSHESFYAVKGTES